MEELPQGVTTLLNKRAPGWTHRVRVAGGRAVFGGLSEETDGEGKQHRVSSVEDVESIGVRLDHPDGRAAVALWVRRPGYECTGKLGQRWHKTTKTKKGTRPPLLMLADPAAIALVSVLLRWRRKPYKFDLAMRGRHLNDPDEHAPRELNSTALGEYLGQT